MNQSDRTLAYHQHAIALIQQALSVLGGEGLKGRGEASMGIGERVRKDAYLNGAPDSEYDPNRQAERVELRCPICGRMKCSLDTERRL